MAKYSSVQLGNPLGVTLSVRTASQRSPIIQMESILESELFSDSDTNRFLLCQSYTQVHLFFP